MKIPDRLSKAAKKRYIENGEGTCPFCHTEDSTKFDYKDFEPQEDGELHQEARCQQCGHRWVDVFRLVDVFGLSDEGVLD